MITPTFFDTINYAICRAVYARLGAEAKDFFQEVGEYHLQEAIDRGLVTLDPTATPLDVLIHIACYLEATGYMERITVHKLSETEAIVEMWGVSVSVSSAKLLSDAMYPSHFMTNAMFAALKRLGVQADLQDMEYDVATAHFKEYWKIL